MFINPKYWKEKKIITIPAQILRVLELFKKNFPNKDAVDPKAINTREKPKVKKIVFITIKLSFFFINLFKEFPEIYDRYPGIRGRTHGDKKLINPAKNAIGIVAFIKNL